MLTVAAHLEKRSASVLDFKGFAQKGGAILSFVRLGMSDQAINQVRIDTGQTDALLACDLVVGASAESLRTLRAGHSRVIANTHQIPVASMVLDPNADARGPELMARIEHAAHPGQCTAFDAAHLAEELLGDSIFANMIVLGYAWQQGLIPVAMEALEKAIELNGVAVVMNKLALGVGRLAAADPATVGLPDRKWSAQIDLDEESVRTILDKHMKHLTAYQNADHARRYQALVAEVEAVERTVRRASEPLKLTTAVARHFPRLLAYKDEYEVARLHTESSFVDELERQFEGNYQTRIPLSVPFLRAIGVRKRLAFGAWGTPILKLLAKAKILRGTRFDPFGRTTLRRAERELACGLRTSHQGTASRVGFPQSAAGRGIGDIARSDSRVWRREAAQLAHCQERGSGITERVRPETNHQPASMERDRFAAT